MKANYFYTYTYMTLDFSSLSINIFLIDEGKKPFSEKLLKKLDSSFSK